METVLDTKALVRFFTNDIPSKANVVRKRLKDDNAIYEIPDVVFPELEYVLTGQVYKLDRSQIIEIYNYLINKKNITSSSQAKLGIYYYKNSKLDCADCFVAAQAKDKRILSYDKKLKELHQKENPSFSD